MSERTNEFRTKLANIILIIGLALCFICGPAIQMPEYKDYYGFLALGSVVGLMMTLIALAIITK